MLIIQITLLLLVNHKFFVTAKNKEPSLAQIEYDETLCEENIETYTPIEELIRNLEITCKINERANDDDVHHLIETIIPETKTQKCFAACWMEKLQIVLQCNMDFVHLFN